MPQHHTNHSSVPENIVRALLRLSEVLDGISRAVLMACCAGMVMVIATQVVFRYGINQSLFWAEELGRVLLVQLTFFGAAVAYRAGAHIGVDTFVAPLPVSAQRFITRVTHGVGLVLFCLMAVYGFQFAGLLSLQMTTTLGISRDVPFYAVPISGCIMAIHSLCAILVPDGQDPDQPAHRESSV